MLQTEMLPTWLSESAWKGISGSKLLGLKLWPVYEYLMIVTPDCDWASKRIIDELQSKSSLGININHSITPYGENVIQCSDKPIPLGYTQYWTATVTPSDLANLSNKIGLLAIVLKPTCGITLRRTNLLNGGWDPMIHPVAWASEYVGNGHSELLIRWHGMISSFWPAEESSQSNLPSMVEFPHKCPRCGKPAYIGFKDVDCSAKCTKVYA